MLALLLGGCTRPGEAPGTAEPPKPSPIPAELTSRRACPYTRHLIDGLEKFGRQVGQTFDCAMVFNDATPTWETWEYPWFLSHADPNKRWGEWGAQPGRRLVITQSMIPDEVPSDWRKRGAAGEYDEHARRLALRLVEAGLGSSTIRLGHEANGTWFKHRLGTPAETREWREYWRRIVLAMRSVPGADFRFDWCIHAGERPVPFADYYPGDDVVDIIGMDFYDLVKGKPADPQARWKAVLGKPGGAGELIAFARKRNKPLSIPEWAVVAPGSKPGGGDNPAFVEGVAGIVHAQPVAYQSYFESPTDGVGLTLVKAPKSLAVYRKLFVEEPKEI